MDKKNFEHSFSATRMKKYFSRNADTRKAITHYQCNIELSESFYPCISILEVMLRNSISRELTILFKREDWYVQFASTPGLTGLNKYIMQANKQIADRKEYISPSKIIAELTLGFWVTLFNVEYERVLWKDLRRVFPYMPKKEKQRKKIAPPLNRFRTIRNRIFHHEPVSWNLEKLKQIHAEMLTIMLWMNKEILPWFTQFDRFGIVCESVEKRLYNQNPTQTIK
jgi:hypothetical protein